MCENPECPYLGKCGGACGNAAEIMFLRKEVDDLKKTMLALIVKTNATWTPFFTYSEDHKTIEAFKYEYGEDNENKRNPRISEPTTEG